MADDPQDQNDDYAAELAKARRAELEAEAEAAGVSVEELEAQGGLGATTTKGDGQVAFVYEKGERVDLDALIERGTDIEYRVKFGGMSLRGGGEPVPLNAKNLYLVARFVSGGLNLVPTHDNDDNVEKVTVYATLKPKSYVDPDSKEGRTLLGVTSILKCVRGLREEGLTDTDIRKEFKAALEETAKAA